MAAKTFSYVLCSQSLISLIPFQTSCLNLSFSLAIDSHIGGSFASLIHLLSSCLCKMRTTKFPSSFFFFFSRYGIIALRPNLD
jgi:hypothetical protein